ncbi:putative flippase GtrA [Bacilli bacterium PM5-3]|nr:putative flippase GtrA [Bacilli bacterium PM5-3]MDH6603513.1 putative flippase GtrA [Bacilli bacterium PM5-9]
MNIIHKYKIHTFSGYCKFILIVILFCLLTTPPVVMLPGFLLSFLVNFIIGYVLLFLFKFIFQKDTID